MVWQVGFGENFKFWEDEWLANDKLRDRYARIYNNFVLKDKNIGSFGRWSNEGWEWAFCWRREWYEWEKPMVEYFMASISQVSLRPDKEDSWLWNDPPS